MKKILNTIWAFIKDNKRSDKWIGIVFGGGFIFFITVLAIIDEIQSGKLEKINDEIREKTKIEIAKNLGIQKEKIEFLKQPASEEDTSFMYIDYLNITSGYPDSTVYYVVPKNKIVALYFQTGASNGLSALGNHTFWSDNSILNSLVLSPDNYTCKVIYKSTDVLPNSLDLQRGTSKAVALVKLKISPPNDSIGVCRVSFPLKLSYAIFKTSDTFEYVNIEFDKVTFNFIVNF